MLEAAGQPEPTGIYRALEAAGEPESTGIYRVLEAAGELEPTGIYRVLQAAGEPESTGCRRLPGSRNLPESTGCPYNVPEGVRHTRGNGHPGGRGGLVAALRASGAILFLLVAALHMVRRILEGLGVLEPRMKPCPAPRAQRGACIHVWGTGWGCWTWHACIQACMLRAWGRVKEACIQPCRQGMHACMGASQGEACV